MNLKPTHSQFVCFWCQEEFKSKRARAGHYSHCYNHPHQKVFTLKRKLSLDISPTKPTILRRSSLEKSSLYLPQKPLQHGVKFSNEMSAPKSKKPAISFNLCSGEGVYNKGGGVLVVDKMLLSVEEQLGSEISPNLVPNAPLQLLYKNGIFLDDIFNADALEVELDWELDNNSSISILDSLPLRRAGGRAYHDILPLCSTLIPDDGFDDTSVPFQTKPNQFGMFRVYPLGKPSYCPDSMFTLADMSDAPTLISNTPVSSVSLSNLNLSLSKTTAQEVSTTIFPNKSIHLYMDFYHGMNSKQFSKAAANSLLKNVIQHPEFRKEEMEGFHMDQGFKALDNHTHATSHFPVQDKWINDVSVTFSMPCDGVRYQSEACAPKLTVGGIQMRKITDVLRSAFSEPAAEALHISGFYSYQQTSLPQSPPLLQYDEVYTSQVFIEEQEAVTKLARSEGCTHEVVIAALILGSDSTQLANFGTQSLWPVYLYLGNLSKYPRTRPSTRSAHHIAYLPKLPDNIQDIYYKEFGKYATADMLSHLRRELFHAIWALLLDDELREAYLHGMDIEFWDSIIRRLFPRFFIYSMDYLEKILYACIKNLSTCPCPTCLVPKSKVQDLGTKRDMEIRDRFQRMDDEDTRGRILEARRLLYEEGKGFKTKAVVAQLGTQSLVATQNAFSKRLGPSGFDFYSIIAPDLMHEVELGVWKMVLIHLLRILHVEGGGAIQALNERYRMFPPFGRDTIRKFTPNVSKMSKWRACDFEDALQCAIPAFHGLIPPPHGTRVRKLLFELATWHTLAKLRIHSELTVRDLEASTFRLGKALRNFENTTCKEYKTTELPAEETARKAKRKPQDDNAKLKKNLKRFNLTTFKVHALGHHARWIRHIGTTDNHTTQTPEVEHKLTKGFATRSSRSKKLLTKGVSKQERREHAMFQARLAEKRDRLKKSVKGCRDARFSFFDSERLPQTDPSTHHHMSKETRPINRINLLQWTKDNSNDPALENFIRCLRSFFLAKLRGIEFDDDENQFSDEELSSIIILNDTIFRHKVLRVNYTTYDMRRGQDSLNARTQSDIMVLSNDKSSGFPYWYARMIGVFHAQVMYVDHVTRKVDQHHMEFLWVRWYGLNATPSYGWKVKNLPRVGYIDPTLDKSPAFGFIDPSQVIRAVHLLPDETSGKSTNGLGATMARKESDNDEDWNYFFVNWFVDRDMFMRYRGGGPGHVAVQGATNYFLQDRDDVDVRFQTNNQPPEEAEAAVEANTHLDLQDIEDQEEWANSDLLVEERDSEATDSESGDGADGENDAAADDDSQGIIHSDDDLGAEDGEDEDDEWSIYGFAPL